MIDIETLTRLKTMRRSGMAEYFENLADTEEEYEAFALAEGEIASTRA